MAPQGFSLPAKDVSRSLLGDIVTSWYPLRLYRVSETVSSIFFVTQFSIGDIQWFRDTRNFPNIFIHLKFMKREHSASFCANSGREVDSHEELEIPHEVPIESFTLDRTMSTTSDGRKLSGRIWRFSGCEFDDLRMELRVGGD